ncbi:hypothetical protein FNV43_RR21649 [Rhamnella rubrinervis]|uniref:Retrotransposon gag domain-containing protein n=1 Tax=Rhamnella rubrinervis TaxID=2594499 RepID=A0A8K0DUM4_9ROSA|nr:hypothetical protein FNV43_RR21649 [Rhamnella rubrinervis]
MGQLFSRMSYMVRGKQDSLVEEPVAIRVVASDVRLDEDSIRRKLERRRQDVFIFQCGPPVVATKPEEEDTEEDPEEDCMGSEDYVSFGYSPQLVDLEVLIPEMTLLAIKVKLEEKEAEFLSLKQGNLSLVEYERRFDELSYY